MKLLDELLAEMRFDIESDLQELAKLYPDKIPTCPSQSHRALRALECVSTANKLDRKLLRYRARLKDFLAVHRSVVLLQRLE